MKLHLSFITFKFHVKNANLLKNRYFYLILHHLLLILSMMKFHFAPVQGHTDAAFRHFHSLNYGGDLSYYSPFIRLEHCALRPRDLKDITSDMNNGVDITPQVIFRDAEELSSLVALLRTNNFSSIDLNMGCPFPLQTGHGRGAATVANTQLAEEIVRIVNNNPDITFSVKMRLGLSSPEEWKSLLPFLNKMSLRHITVHPRVARQQYDGELYLDSFEEILAESYNPVVFNGDIKTPSDIDSIITKFPSISGIMIGRGLLSRPSLIAEYTSGKDWDKKDRLDALIKFHSDLFGHYKSTLCGDNQLLSKIKPFWEYSEEEIGRKAWKNIKKAGNMAKYHTALTLISTEI